MVTAGSVGHLNIHGVSIFNKTSNTISSWSPLAVSRRSASLLPNFSLSQQQQQAPRRDIVCAHSPELNGIVLAWKPRRHQASIRESYKPECLHRAPGGNACMGKEAGSYMFTAPCGAGAVVEPHQGPSPQYSRTRSTSYHFYCLELYA